MSNTRLPPDFLYRHELPISERFIYARGLVTQGWTQGNYNLKGSYCAAAAISASCVNNPPAKIVMCHSMALDIDEDVWPNDGKESAICRWNDICGRRREDVIAMFDRQVIKWQAIEARQGEAA